MNSLNEIKSKLLLYNLVVLCFLFPLLPQLIPFLLIIITILSAFNFKKIAKKDIKYYLPFILIISFYIFNILGLIWSEDIVSGIKHLEIKLSFIVIPILYLNQNLLESKNSNFLYTAFILGNCTTAIYSISKATFTYAFEGVNHFTYTLLSPNFHPTYLSMYAIFCLILLIENKKIILLNKWIKYLLISLLTIWVILLSSKINIIILFFGILFLAFYAIRTAQNKAKALLTTILTLSSVSFLILLTPAVNERFKTAFNSVIDLKHPENNEIESNAARLLIWECAYKLVLEHPIVGVGTGDVNNELVNAYGNYSYNGIKEKRLNAHNQYFQTAISTGIPSLLGLIIFFFLPIISSTKRLKSVTSCFIIIFVINALVESTLENQAGVVYFIFFYFLLLRTDNYERIS